VTGFKLPLALSLTAHALLLALLLALPAPAPPLQLPVPAGGIEVAFAPSLPEPEKPPTPQLPVKAEPPPPPPVVTPPPPPPPPPPIEPPPPAPEATAVIPETPPPPPRKPAIPTVFKPVPRRPERERPAPSFAAPTPSAASPPQTAFAPTPAPARVPSTEISPSYRALLSEWLESHKRYPEGAREHGEEGRAVLRFVVERSGRVSEFAVIKSTGYPDLDAALESMMRGATLPPFPADMDQPSIEVSVAIRFSLEG
jgi:periplasmic protein TonB